MFAYVLALAPGPAGAALPLGVKGQLAAPGLGSTVDRPSSAIWADLDGDGDLDVVGSEGPDDVDGELFWFEYNHTGGFFGPKDTLIAFAGAQVVHAADIDDDGDLDLVATSFFADEVAWFENSAGDASAWTQHSIATSQDGMDDVTTADLDGDGDLDVIGSVRFGGAVRIWINDGTPATGAWSSQTPSSLAGATGVDTGDIDRDGDLDIVATFNVADTLVWYANGSAALNVWTPHTIATTLDGALSVRLADMDGDGDLDAVAAAGTGGMSPSGSIAWWENDGNPVNDVGDWANHSIDPSFDLAYHVQVADLDHDGDVDVIASALLEDEIRCYENLDGVGGSWAQKAVISSFDGARWADVGDPDKDGDLDVVVVGNGTSHDEVSFFPNESIFQTGEIDSVQVAFTSALQFVSAVAAGDIDEDGDIDLVGGGDLAWFENLNGHGTDWTVHTIDTAFIPNAVRVVDLDHDGDPDLVASESGDRLLWYENDGTPADDSGGGLGTSWTVHTIESSVLLDLSDIALGDLNGDGHLDVVATAVIDDEILWWENDGSPADDSGGDGNSWTESTIAASPDTDNPKTVHTGDIDSDGDLDVVSVSQTAPDYASWWENDGTSTWTRTGIMSVAVGGTVVDYDRNGTLDLISSESIGGNVQVALNTAGDGSAWFFVILHHLTGTPFPFAIAHDDFDLDGDIDTALTVNQDDEVLWLENVGSVPWTPHTIDSSSDDPRSLMVADVDGDGDGDLVVGIRNDKQVVWYRNESGQFALATTDQAPVVDAGQEDDVLKIELSHSGRAGDTDAELATLELLLEETAGDPLTGSEAQSLFEEINVYADTNNDGSWDPADDLLQSETVFILDNGILSLDLPDGDTDLQAAVGEIERIFVTTLLSNTAGQSPPVSFRVTHLTSASSRGEDADHDTGLRLGWADDVASTLVVLVDCYQLTLSHTGPGLDPTPDIANSTGCPVGTYLENEVVTLTATPDPDYVVAGWSGTDNNGSTATVNTVTMPAMAHAASVSYVFPDHIVISNETLSGGNIIREACLTVTAGPAVHVDTGSIVTFRANERISLNNGFSVGSGSVFYAKLATPGRCGP